MDKFTQHDGFTLSYRGEDLGWSVGDSPLDRSTAIYHLGGPIVEATERDGVPISFDVAPSTRGQRVAFHGLGGY